MAAATIAVVVSLTRRFALFGDTVADTHCRRNHVRVFSFLRNSVSSRKCTCSVHYVKFVVLLVAM